MPQTMLEWAAREPLLTLGFVYILYTWLYNWIVDRDIARTDRVYNAYAQTLPHGAIPQAPLPAHVDIRVNWFVRIWPHTAIQVCVGAVYAAWFVSALWRAITLTP